MYRNVFIRWPSNAIKLVWVERRRADCVWTTRYSLVMKLCLQSCITRFYKNTIDSLSSQHILQFHRNIFVEVISCPPCVYDDSLDQSCVASSTAFLSLCFVSQESFDLVLSAFIYRSTLHKHIEKRRFIEDKWYSTYNISLMLLDVHWSVLFFSKLINFNKYSNNYDYSKSYK